MSGIGCARTLAKEGKDFLLISKDIGGRVVTSADGQVNYGAFYIRSDYHNVLPFVKLGRRIASRSLGWEKIKGRLTFWNKIFNYPVSMIKIAAHLLIFNFHYQRFKKNCEKFSQVEVLEKDPYLKKMHEMPANDFIKNHQLEILLPLFDPIVNSTTFLSIREAPLSAAGMLLMLMIGLYPTNEFIMDKDLLVEGISGQVISDEVVSLLREDDRWLIKTNSGQEYLSKNLVMATPIDITKRLLNLDFPTNQPISVYMTHLRGELVAEYEVPGNFILFSPDKTEDIVIAKEPNGTLLFYSHDSAYSLEKYFKNYEIIAEKFWSPAFFVGHSFIPCLFPDSLFIIGDHNIVGMEDAYITGIYAGNKISGKTV